MFLRFQEGMSLASNAAGWGGGENAAGGLVVAATEVARLAGSKTASKAPTKTVASTSGKESESFMANNQVTTGQTQLPAIAFQFYAKEKR